MNPVVNVTREGSMSQGSLMAAAVLDAATEQVEAFEEATVSSAGSIPLQFDVTPPTSGPPLKVADRFDENPLIVSTSGYLVSVIQKHLRAHGGVVEAKALVAGVLEEMRYVLLIPSSNFSCPDDMLSEYASFMKPLTAHEQAELAGAFLAGVAQARTEGRYFGRHISELKKFKNEQAAVDAFVKFLHEHGYRLRDHKRFLDQDARVRTERSRELFKLLVATRDPRQHLVHESKGEGAV